MPTRPSSGVRSADPGPAGDHIPTLAYAEYFVALACQCRRDVAAVQAHADALLAMAACPSLASALSRVASCGGGRWPCRAGGRRVAHLRQAFGVPTWDPVATLPIGSPR